MMFKEIFFLLLVVVVVVALVGDRSYDQTMGNFTPHTFSNEAYEPGNAMDTSSYEYELRKDADGQWRAHKIAE